MHEVSEICVSQILSESIGEAEPGRLDENLYGKLAWKIREMQKSGIGVLVFAILSSG